VGACDPEPSSVTERNKARCRLFLEHVWNAGNLADAEAFIHPDYDVLAVGRSPEAVRQNITAFRAAFPDLQWVVEDIVAEGDLVALRLTLHGTHLGAFRGIAPTGRRITMQEMVFWQLEHGRLRAGWFQADIWGVRMQLGAEKRVMLDAGAHHHGLLRGGMARRGDPH
jgi:predicted ester cyclase